MAAPYPLHVYQQPAVVALAAPFVVDLETDSPGVVLQATWGAQSPQLVRFLALNINRVENDAGGTAGSAGFSLQWQFEPGGDWEAGTGWLPQWSPGTTLTRYGVTTGALSITDIDSIVSGLLLSFPAMPLNFDATTDVTDIGFQYSLMAVGVPVYGVRLVYYAVDAFTAGQYRICPTLVVG